MTFVERARETRKAWRAVVDAALTLDKLPDGSHPFQPFPRDLPAALQEALRAEPGVDPFLDDLLEHLRMNECGVCGEDFGSLEAFDAHHVGAHDGDRRCLGIHEMTVQERFERNDLRRLHKTAATAARS